MGTRILDSVMFTVSSRKIQCSFSKLLSNTTPPRPVIMSSVSKINSDELGSVRFTAGLDLKGFFQSK